MTSRAGIVAIALVPKALALAGAETTNIASIDAVFASVESRRVYRIGNDIFERTVCLAPRRISSAELDAF